MINKILLLLLLTLSLNAFTISHKEIKNANTVLIEIINEDIDNVKLTFDKQNIDFFKNPFKKNSFYALVPISYYQNSNDYKIIISYIKNNQKIFKGLDLKVVDGDYKSETLNVQASKVKPNLQNQERVKKENEEATKIYKTSSKKILWDEDFIYPLNSKITSEFGTKRVYNGELKSYHGGTDFQAKDDTPIIASNSGVIKIAQDRFYAGNSIVIDHGHGVYSCYFHLNSMYFKVGDFVKKGQVIGLSGSTGRITGPHLHFGIRIQGLQVDPLQAIAILNNLKTSI